MVIVALCKLVALHYIARRNVLQLTLHLASDATMLRVQQSYFAMLTIISNNRLYIEHLNEKQCVLPNKTLSS